MAALYTRSLAASSSVAISAIPGVVIRPAGRKAWSGPSPVETPGIGGLRTLVAKDGKAYVQAGAGIVMDSNPTAEYEETRDKARALVRALEMAQEGF